MTQPARTAASFAAALLLGVAGSVAERPAAGAVWSHETKG
jgi:hypothetical protein